MVNVKNNPMVLDQLAKAYMAGMIANKDNATETATKLLEDSSKVDAFVSSNGSANAEEVKEEIIDMFLDMSDDELQALMEEYGVEVPGEVEDTTTEDATKVDATKADAAKDTAKDAEKVAIDNADKAAATTATNSTTATDEIPDGEESSKIKEEIEELESDRDANYEEIEKIEEDIEDLAAKAEENILKAAKIQEEKVEEHEEDSQKAVEENINAYVEANKEGGEGMTRDELQQNIKGSLSQVPNVADAVSAAIAANEQINEIDSKLSDLNELIQDTQSIETEIDAKNVEYEASKEAEKEAAEAAKSCDPIGFTMGEGEEQVQYDFIVDDGAFDSTSDFLGAENQWEEMKALDTDGDNVVSSKELEAGNIKAVKTDADGNQQVVSLAEEFGEDFSIDLGSYTQGGSHSAIDTTTDSDADGTVDQQLLGTFSMNVNGQTVSGYNTLDDTDWLAENYGLSTDATETKDSAITYSEQLKPHVDFFKTYTQKVADMKAELSETWKSIGLTEDSLKALSGEAAEDATKEVDEEDITANAPAAEETEEVTEQAEIGNPAASEETTEVASEDILEELFKEEEQEPALI